MLKFKNQIEFWNPPSCSCHVCKRYINNLRFMQRSDRWIYIYVYIYIWYVYKSLDYIYIYKKVYQSIRKILCFFILMTQVFYFQIFNFSLFFAIQFNQLLYKNICWPLLIFHSLRSCHHERILIIMEFKDAKASNENEIKAKFPTHFCFLVLFMYLFVWWNKISFSPFTWK